MYNEKYYPFYMNFTTPEFWEEERLQERENQLMQSLYPRTARKIQQKVLEECDRIDYPGSIIYDEYPDKFMMDQLCRKIRTDIENGGMDEMEQDYREEDYVEAEQRHDRRKDNLLDELVHVLLFQEMRRRRCRNHRCRRYF